MKNKYILGFILGIFLIGLVSAGITGYSITLSKSPVLDDNLGEASVTSVSRGGVATFEFVNPETEETEILFGKPGQILTTPSGVQVEVDTVKPGNLFRRPSAGITVVPVARPMPVKAGTACIWIDRYGSSNIDGQLINSICPTNYFDVAYELRRDYWIYNDSACLNEISQSSDHQIMQSYGATIPKIGEEAGNMNVCSKRFGTNYGTIEQMYDGVLCCK